MITFKTASGSTYEVNSIAKEIKRVDGKIIESDVKSDTWHPYLEISVATTTRNGHKQAVVVFQIEDLGRGYTQVTRMTTSPIVEGLDKLLAVVTAGRGQA